MGVDVDESVLGHRSRPVDILAIRPVSNDMLDDLEGVTNRLADQSLVLRCSESAFE